LEKKKLHKKRYLNETLPIASTPKRMKPTNTTVGIVIHPSIATKVNGSTQTYIMTACFLFVMETKLFLNSDILIKKFIDTKCTYK
jgi:hypothetical protein